MQRLPTTNCYNGKTPTPGNHCYYKEQGRLVRVTFWNHLVEMDLGVIFPLTLNRHQS